MLVVHFTGSHMVEQMSNDDNGNRWEEQERSSQGTFMATGDAMDPNPICANFPVEVSDLLRDKSVVKNRAQYIRDAVRAAMVRDGLLDE